MSNLLSNLAQRGAGLEPATVVQPHSTPYFPVGLRIAHAAQPEYLPVDVTMTEVLTSPDTAASTPQAPLVGGPGPQYTPPARPASSRSQVGMATTSEREPRPDELDKTEQKPGAISDPKQVSQPASLQPEPRAESISDPERILQQASSPKPRSEQSPPLGLTAGLEATAEPAEPPAPSRPVPRMQEVRRWEAAANKEHPPVSVPEPTPSERSSGLQALPPARLTDRLSASTPLEKSDVGPPVPQPIQVRIGTVEVRATTPPTAPPPAPRSPQGPTGFDGYAMIRSYRGWERH
jgi:hypothetical protein